MKSQLATCNQPAIEYSICRIFKIAFIGILFGGTDDPPYGMLAIFVPNNPTTKDEAQYWCKWQDSASPRPPPHSPTQYSTPSQILMIVEVRHHKNMTQILRDFNPSCKPNALLTQVTSSSTTFSVPTNRVQAHNRSAWDWWLAPCYGKKLEIIRMDQQDKTSFATHYREGQPKNGSANKRI